VVSEVSIQMPFHQYTPHQRNWIWVGILLLEWTKDYSVQSYRTLGPPRWEQCPDFFYGLLSGHEPMCLPMNPSACLTAVMGNRKYNVHSMGNIYSFACQ
jgi:hypothetical protein